MQKIRVRLRKNWPLEDFEVISVGDHTVRLKRSDGIVIQVKRKLVQGQLPKSLLPTKVKYAMLPTPMGGQPSTRNRRRK